MTSKNNKEVLSNETAKAVKSELAKYSEIFKVRDTQKIVREVVNEVVNEVLKNWLNKNMDKVLKEVIREELDKTVKKQLQKINKV